ncbi:MAG: hypothetical protein U0990_11985 [Candidatus Nanopelagicales bacterium]|nr:hypothetical protein [Candidatus Nanopelagicales bacterium]MDZ4250786.1 hypothetical protein [Candidatus Nanopelagicales bacterium]
MQRERVLRSMAIAAAASASLVMASCTTNPEQPASTPTTASATARTWMETLYSDKPNTKLGSILIPGTHDSGTGGIDTETPCENQVIAGTLQPIVALLDTEPCVLAGFSRTQDVDLKTQLESGIRYLDMRIGVPADQAVKPTGQPIPLPKNPLSVELVTQHTVVSQPLGEALDGILTFAQEHPKEQVILDFQHVNLPKDPQVADYYKKILDRYLHDYAPRGLAGAVPVCSRAWSSDVIKVDDSDLATKVSFGEAWRAERNLIVLTDPEGLPASPCYRDRVDAVLSQWPKTQDPEVSATYNKAELRQRRQKLAATPPKCEGTQSVGAKKDGTPKPGTDPANWCGFFVSQMQLSIGNTMYAGCVLDPRAKCSLFALSQTVNNSIANSVESWSEASLPVNIVIVDFFNYADPSVVDTMLRLNAEALTDAS